MDIKKAIHLLDLDYSLFPDDGEYYLIAIQALENQLKDKWIPVSEKPKEDGSYLTTIDGAICGIEEPFTGTCWFENGKWDEDGYVLAWKPLPEPYKEVK